jgi:hypothetical protein
MGAPNLYTLLDVETEVESVFAAYLGTTLGLPTVTSDSNTVLVTPRVEIICELIDEGMNQATIPSGSLAGTVLYSQKHVRITIDLIYSPARPQNPGTLRGTLREASANYPSLKAAFAVHGYYLLAPDTLRQTAGARTIDRVEKTETLRTVYEAVLFINPLGYPA